VQHVAAKSVKLPHNDRVAVADAIEERSETGAVITRARHGVGKRLYHSGGRKHSILLIKSLCHCTHARVSDKNARMGTNGRYKTVDHF
jgi:hypothetical protein